MCMRYGFFALCLLAAGAAGAGAQEPVRRTVTGGEVVVTGTRSEADARLLPVTVSVVGREQLAEAYRESVLPTLGEQVPGLFVTSRGMAGYGVSTGAAGSVSVRGVGGGARLLVLIDGQPQYAGLYGHPVADMYATPMAERVEVVRGPASLLYGSNAMGGVVNVVTRAMPRDGVETEVQTAAGSYGTVQGHVASRARRGRLALAGGLGFNHTDGHRANYRFEQYGGFAKAARDISARWRAEAGATLTRFKSQNPGEADNPYIDNRMWVTRGFASAGVSNDYGRTAGVARVFCDFGHHRVDDGYHPGAAPRRYLYKHDDVMAGASLYQSASLWSGNRTTLGLDWQHMGGRAWNDSIAPGAGDRTLVDRTEDELGGYVDFRQDVAAWATVDAGLRVDRHSHVGTELVPQAGVALHLPRRVELKATVGKGFRNPTFKELFMFAVNPGLAPERMVNYELAYAQRLMDGRLRVGANVFYADIDNLIAVVMADGKRMNRNTGAGENWGGEAEASLRVGTRWRVDANYSFLRMSRATRTEGAPEHKAYAGAAYEARRWAATCGLQWLGGLYTQVGEAEAKEDVPLLGASLTYKPADGLRLFARGENLLWRRYELARGFPMPRATVMAGVRARF